MGRRRPRRTGRRALQRRASPGVRFLLAAQPVRAFRTNGGPARAQAVALV